MKEDVFEFLVEPYRRELLAHCYRMFGNGQDAEDALQETLLRAWRGIAEFQERSSLRTWLHKIATHTCLNMLTKRSRKVLVTGYFPPVDPELPLKAPIEENIWLEPYPDALLYSNETTPEARYEQRESLEIAFMAAIQLLPPKQRAAFILCDVLGFTAQETAETLHQSTAAVNSALQRARLKLEQHRPKLSQQTEIHALGDKEVRRLVSNYIDAMQRADLSAMLALLTEDVKWSMPPIPSWYYGKENIARFLTQHPFPLKWRHLVTQANGQIAVGCYFWNKDKSVYEAICLDVLTLRDGHIAAVTGFFSGKFVRLCGLPTELN